MPEINLKTLRTQGNQLIVLNVVAVDWTEVFDEIFREAETVDLLREYLIRNSLECVLK